MADYCITCCSTADLSKQDFEKRDVKYVCFHFDLDGNDHLDDLWQSMTPEELYKQMIDGAMTKTSQVSVGEYKDFFEPILKEGTDILHVTLSSGISGSYNSAVIAANDLREEYPARKIYVVDSLTAASGYGLMIDTLVEMRDSGKSIDEVHQWIVENHLRQQAWFFSTDLTFFVRGGRVSKVSGFVGNILNICPLLNVNREGKLIPREKVPSKRKVIKRIVEKMEEEAEDGINYSGKCYISHSCCYDDARAVADLIESKFPKLNGKVEIFPIGATIGSHTGPGTVALFFWGREKLL